MSGARVGQEGILIPRSVSSAGVGQEGILIPDSVSGARVGKEGILISGSVISLVLDLPPEHSTLRTPVME